MQAKRKPDLWLEVAAAFAVLAMAIQIVFAPLLSQQHALTAETDFNLAIICGLHSNDSADKQNTPPANPHLHDCPCCLSTSPHAVLPEPPKSVEPVLFVAQPAGAPPLAQQVVGIAAITHTQLPRPPPALS